MVFVIFDMSCTFLNPLSSRAHVRYSAGRSPLRQSTLGDVGFSPHGRHHLPLGVALHRGQFVLHHVFRKPDFTYSSCGEMSAVVHKIKDALSLFKVGHSPCRNNYFHAIPSVVCE